MFQFSWGEKCAFINVQRLSTNLDECSFFDGGGRQQPTGPVGWGRMGNQGYMSSALVKPYDNHVHVCVFGKIWCLARDHPDKNSMHKNSTHMHFSLTLPSSCIPLQRTPPQRHLEQPTLKQDPVHPICQVTAHPSHMTSSQAPTPQAANARRLRFHSHDNHLPSASSASGWRQPVG
jgi:hypothetical protein